MSEMEVDDTLGGVHAAQASPSHTSMPIVHSDISNTQRTSTDSRFTLLAAEAGLAVAAAALPAPRDSFRDIQVKVHIRKPERDSWLYMGRGVVSQDVFGHSSRVVVRSVSTGKVIAVFSETSDLEAEKRGNFVVISVVQGAGVVSWSLNALNNSETLRLLASIDLACYKCKQALADPRSHSKARRRIERVIKDDRRRRHRRRKDQDSMIDAFSRQTIATGAEEGPPI